MTIILSQLPPPPPGKTGWPWTVATDPCLFPTSDGQFWPKISIVTPSFNQGEFLEETIRSVLLQNYPDLEYIIIDGGSTDNSVEIIRKYEHWLKYWVSEKDDGQSDALNKGFSLCEGSICGWLNSDDIYYSRALYKIASLDWEKTDFCFGKGMWISRSGKDIGFYPTFKPNIYSLYLTCTLCQPTVFFKKDVRRQLGDFSQDYYCAFDYEFWLRAVMRKMRFRFVPMLLAKSRMYSQNKSLSAHMTFLNDFEEIKKLHYKNIRLNSLLLRVYHFFVYKYSHKQGERLLKILSQE